MKAERAMRAAQGLQWLLIPVDDGGLLQRGLLQLRLIIHILHTAERENVIVFPQVTVRLSEAFKFAPRLTNTRGIQPYFLESNGIIGWIIRRYAMEETYGELPKLTFDELDDGVRLWVARKGLEDVVKALCKASLLLRLSRR